MLARLWPSVLSLGWLLIALAGAELLLALVAIGVSDGQARSFGFGATVSALIGTTAVLATKGRAFTMGFRDAVILTVAAWFVLPILAAIPLLVGLEVTFVDAFFEMVSGITTTGSTVLVGLDSLPPSLLLWRSLLQWLGGFGIIALALVILPFLRIGGMQLLRLESTDRSEKAFPRVSVVARTVGEIYVALTAACFATYLVLGMTPFDAINHAFTTIPTGGFSTHDASFGYFESPALRWAAVVFMIAGAIPFLAYLRLLRRGELRERFDTQVRAMLLILVVIVIGLAVYLKSSQGFGVGSALTEAAFNVVSIVTTTGYASSDYMQWGNFAVTLFFMIMFVGGCSGSTSGGVKIMRFQIMGSTIVQQVRRLIYPHVVSSVRFGSQMINSDQIVSIGIFVTAYVGLVIVGTLVLSLTGLDFISASSGAAQAVGNVGPGLGPIIGPAGNFSTLDDLQKVVLAVAMVVGRLEILSVLVLLAPSFYR